MPWSRAASAGAASVSTFMVRNASWGLLRGPRPCMRAPHATAQQRMHGQERAGARACAGARRASSR